jgi:hypothetical protein
VLEKATDEGWQKKLISKVHMMSKQEWLGILSTVGRMNRLDSISDVIFHYMVENPKTAIVVFASRYISDVAFAKLQRVAWMETVIFCGVMIRICQVDVDNFLNLLHTTHWVSSALVGLGPWKRVHSQ